MTDPVIYLGLGAILVILGGLAIQAGLPWSGGIGIGIGLIICLTPSIRQYQGQVNHAPAAAVFAMEARAKMPVLPWA